MTDETFGPATGERTPDGLAADGRMATDGAAKRATDERATGGAAETDGAAERTTEARLARIHLRTGAHGLARAELEALAGRATLDGESLLDLAEVRWRTGDLAGAGEAAQAYLARGTDVAVALVIAAEAAAALGRPGEARRLATRAIAAADRPLDAIFAGIPRGGAWPNDPLRGEQAVALFPPGTPAHGGPGGAGNRRARHGHGGRPVRPAAGRGGGPGAVPGAGPWTHESSHESSHEPSKEGAAGSTAAPGAGRSAQGAPSVAIAGGRAAGADASWLPRDVTAGVVEEPSLWGDDEATVAAEPLPDPDEELVAARAALERDDHAAAALHLGLVLRFGPQLAPAVLDAAAGHRSPGLELVRGDALRLVGHEAEARKAYTAAARAAPGRETPAD